MAAPALAVLVVFWLVPILLVVAFSFFHWTDGTNPQFSGLSEYATLFQDSLFWHSIVTTIAFVVITVVFGTLLSFVTALLLRAGLLATGLLRALVFLPYVTPIVATATVWIWIYQPGTGVLDQFLGLFGLPGNTAWLNSPALALIGLCVYTIWYTFGFTTLLFLAGMGTIPNDCLEAASLDGATAWKRLRYVTVPLLAPTTLFIVVISTITAFQAFTQIFTLTNGGPLNATTTLTYYIYTVSFQFFHFGQASAAATIYVILIGLLVLLQFRASRRSYKG